MSVMTAKLGDRLHLADNSPAMSGDVNDRSWEEGARAAEPATRDTRVSLVH